MDFEVAYCGVIDKVNFADSPRSVPGVFPCFTRKLNDQQFSWINRVY